MTAADLNHKLWVCFGPALGMDRAACGEVKRHCSALVLAFIACDPAIDLRTASIVSGQDAVRDDYRFIVSLRSEEDRHFCTGTLIAPRWVLTAAHCVCDDRQPASVLVGLHNRNDPASGERAVPVEISYPDNYDCGGEVEQTSDIALIRIDRTTSKIPLVLNDENTFPFSFDLATARAQDANTRALGFGRDDTTTPTPILQQVDLPALTNNSCRSGAAPEHLCYGLRNSGKGACFGDSGGPLISYDHGAPIQVAIHSFATGVRGDIDNYDCANEIDPSVGVRVSSHIDWIRSKGVPFIARSDIERSANAETIVGLTSLSVGARRRHLAAVNNGSQTTEYSWSLGQWSKTNVAVSAGSYWRHGAVAALESSWTDDFGVRRIVVFTRRDNGDLISFERRNSIDWEQQNITSDAAQNGFDRLAIHSTPVAIRGGYDITRREVIDVFASGDGHEGPGSLLSFRGFVAAGDTWWLARDLTQILPHAPRIEGRLVALNSAGTNDPAGRSQHVFYRSASGTLGHYYRLQNSGAWGVEDLTDKANARRQADGLAPHDLRIAGDVVALNGDSQHNHGVRSQHVFARNPLNQLIHFFWSNSGGWSGESLALVAEENGDNAVGACDIVTDPIATNNTNRGNGGVQGQDVFALNSDGELIHFNWLNYAGWRCENLTEKVENETGTRFELEGDIRLQIGSSVGNLGVQEMNVFGRRNGRLIQFTWLNYAGWRAYDLTQLSGGFGIQFRDPMVVFQGPNKGNAGIESVAAVTKAPVLDPEGLDWLNYRGWDWFYVP